MSQNRLDSASTSLNSPLLPPDSPSNSLNSTRRSRVWLLSTPPQSPNPSHQHTTSPLPLLKTLTSTPLSKYHFTPMIDINKNDNSLSLTLTPPTQFSNFKNVTPMSNIPIISSNSAINIPDHKENTLFIQEAPEMHRKIELSNAPSSIYPHGYYIMTESIDSTQLLNNITIFLQAHQSCIQFHRKFSIFSCIFTPEIGSPCDFTIKAYSIPSLSNIILTCERMSGDGFVFAQFYKKFHANFVSNHIKQSIWSFGAPPLLSDLEKNEKSKINSPPRKSSLESPPLLPPPSPPSPIKPRQNVSSAECIPSIQHNSTYNIQMLVPAAINSIHLTYIMISRYHKEWKKLYQPTQQEQFTQQTPPNSTGSKEGHNNFDSTTLICSPMSMDAQAQMFNQCFQSLTNAIISMTSSSRFSCNSTKHPDYPHLASFLYLLYPTTTTSTTTTITTTITTTTTPPTTTSATTHSSSPTHISTINLPPLSTQQENQQPSSQNYDFLTFLLTFPVLSVRISLLEFFIAIFKLFPDPFLSSNLISFISMKAESNILGLYQFDALRSQTIKKNIEILRSYLTASSKRGTP